MNNCIPFLSILLFLLLQNYSGFSQQRMIWSDVNGHKILSSNIEGGEIETIFTGNYPSHLVLDSNNQKIYWTDIDKNAVYSISTINQEIEVFIDNLPSPRGITLTPENQVLVISSDKILRYDTTGEYINTVQSGLADPLDLFVKNSKVYWSDGDKDVIFRSNLDGSEKKTAIRDVYYAFDLEFDQLNDIIYYAQYTGAIPYSGIYQVDINGENHKVIVEEFTQGIALDAVNRQLYWSTNIWNTVYRANLDSLSNKTKLITRYLSSPGDVLLNSTSGKFYFINLSGNTLLWEANLSDGSSTRSIARSEIFRPTRFGIDTISNKIYWVNSPEGDNSSNASILRANLDGTGLEKIISDDRLGRPFGFALDLNNEKIYWTDLTDKSISCADLNGSNDTVIISGLEMPHGISIDHLNNKLYWTDPGSKTIQRANLDGTEIESVVDTGISVPYEIGFAYNIGKIYWTDYAQGSINRSNFNGTDIETIITTESPIFQKPNSLYIDEKSGKIYFTIDYSNSRIQRANLDGTEIEDLYKNRWGSQHDIELINSGLVNSLENISTDMTKVDISPNPFSSTIKISTEKIMISLLICNNLGQTIYERHNIRGKVNMLRNLNFREGMYWLVIGFSDGTFLSKPLIKQ